MTRLILREIARWGRAVGAPLAALTIVAFGPALLTSGTVRLVPAGPFFTGWLATVAVALTWLLMASVRATLQLARDNQAAQHLQTLRDGATAEHAHLLCIERTLGRSPAGQRVVVSDVRDGTTADAWMSEADLPNGAFALVILGRGVGRLVDWMGPAEVTAARRAERDQVARQRIRDARSANRAGRIERKVAADVVRAAEALTRLS